MSSTRLSGAEIVASFMERKPRYGDDPGAVSVDGWWWMEHMGWCPSDRGESLDALHEVEARLTDDQWEAYEAHYTANCVGMGLSYAFRRHVHASAEQKVRDLAAVLRPIVEAEASHE